MAWEAKNTQHDLVLRVVGFIIFWRSRSLATSLVRLAGL